MSKGDAPERSRSYWVYVRFPEGSEHPGRFIWKIVGDSPESVQKKLRTRYPDPNVSIRVVRQTYEGERYLP